MTQLNSATYNEKKASEVAFYFLKRAEDRGGFVTKLRLIKWLYLAERAAYRAFGEPLTGDHLCSMRHGPVLSSTLYLVERPSNVARTDGSWKSVVQVSPETRHDYLNIHQDCPYKTIDDLRQLSDAEIEILDTVWENFGKQSSKQLETYLHDARYTPEWQWSEGDGSNPIELEDLFMAFGYNEKQTAQFVESIQAFESINSAFA